MIDPLYQSSCLELPILFLHVVCIDLFKFLGNPISYVLLHQFGHSQSTDSFGCQ